MVLNREDGAYFVLIVSVLAFFVSLMQMLPNACYLKLDNQGFEYRSLFRSYFIKWQDVDVFFPVSVRGVSVYHPKMVGWRLKGKPLSGLTYFLCGAHDTLRENYGMHANELAELLNYELKKRCMELKHNKFKNEEASKAGTDAQKEARPF